MDLVRPLIAGTTTTATPGARDATPPGAGGLRDALLAFFSVAAGLGAAAATAEVTRRTGSPELGQAAGDVARQGIPQLAIAIGACVTALSQGGLTWLRKRRANRETLESMAAGH